ncbi:MAG TPA: hypothetical protein VHT73_15805 [Thermodesulfobacteriota bacterium]|nr:hypothetical protein [Thermodesulfobacteriota bacterium]
MKTRANDPISITFNQDWDIGQAVIRRYAVWIRFHPKDFLVKSCIAHNLDWQIFYDNPCTFYDKIQAEVGILRDSKLPLWRLFDEFYPIPKMPGFSQGRIIE